MSNPLPPSGAPAPAPDPSALSAAWEAIQPELRALPDDLLKRPMRPVGVVLQRSQDLATWLQNHPQARQDLEDTGLSADFVARLWTLIHALDHAQAQWSQDKILSKSDEHVDLESQGFKVRRRLLDASDLALRGDRIALSTLAAVERGRGLDDLIEDLKALANLVEQHQDAFASNKRFQAPQEAQAARELAHQLHAQRSNYRDQARVRGSSVRARNAAYTLLRQHLDLIKRAARFAFRDSQTLSAHLDRLGLV